MRTKHTRLLAIRKILNDQKITSQEKLLALLQKQGFHLTQATLSRDMKFLRVAKVPDSDKGYVYRMADEQDRIRKNTGQDPPPVNGFLSIDFAFNLGVIKTLPGYASSIASAIDALDSFSIMGTVAGDDTILLIMREGATKADVLNSLVFLIPDIVEYEYNH